MDHSHTKNDSHDCSKHNAGVGGVFQTLDEIDFARGPWNYAMNGDYPGVCQYLDKGGEPNLRDSAGYTMLHYAARSGNLNICKVLIQNHASVNVTTRSGNVTPLHRAASAGYNLLVQELLDKGADPKMLDNDGKTALHRAAEGNNAKCCAILVDVYPEAQNKRDNRAKYPKDYVPCTESHSETYKILWWRNNGKEID